MPLELLAITSHAFSFSTYTQRARTVGYHAKPPTNPNAASPNRGNTQESIATTSSPSTSSPAQSTEHYRRIERYCLAPYPKDLVPIQNAELRQEVFRKSRLNGTTASPNLSPPYYHTALEKKGDELTRLIADEVAIYWCLQFHQDYVTAATLLNSHNYHPVSSLVRNTHWTALCTSLPILSLSSHCCFV